MKNRYFLLLLILFLVLLYLSLYKIYMPRVNEFGCFDDCFNFIAGYFMLRDKALYSEIFFNHQPLMAYISYFIQSVSYSENIYAFVLVHRQFIMIFSFLMSLFIVLRFRLVGFLFVLFYELSKFYLFGDRFLAEGIIVYPFVYMMGLLWNKYTNTKLSRYDYILSAIFAWFIIFMREPYAPLALFISLLLLWGKSLSVNKNIAVLIFLILTLVTLSSLPIKEYIFNVVTVNFTTVLKSESQGNNLLGLGILKVFFYPVFVFFEGKWNMFRYFIIGLSLLFLFLFVFLVFFRRRFKLGGIVFLVLGFANVRAVTPGQIFYEAFHMLPWYGLFIMIIFLMMKELYILKKNLTLFPAIVALGLIVYIIASPNSYIHDEIDTHVAFITNFGKELQIGEVVRALSEPGDTLFLDGADDLIYWQSKLLSPYKYSWYTSSMQVFPIYRAERLKMFSTTPPDFYYRFCTKQEIPTFSLPMKYRSDYVRLHSFGKPTCLYVKKTKIPQISNDQWKKAKEFLYERPKNT